MKLIVVAIFLSLLFSCQHGLTPYSQRPAGGIPKMGSSKTLGNSRPIGSGSSQTQEFYIKNNNVQIVPKKAENETGSLFNIEDSRNYFFAARAPVRVGSYL